MLDLSLSRGSDNLQKELIPEYLGITGRMSRYVYTTGRIRGMEKNLLQEADFTRLKETSGSQEILEFLKKNPPYAEAMKSIDSTDEFERGLERHIYLIYQELCSFVPEPELVGAFWIKYDFHNLKVLLRLRFRPDHPEAFALDEFGLSSGTMDLAQLREAVDRQDFSGLLPDFSSLLSEIFPLIEQRPHPREIDNFLDQRFFRLFSEKLAQYKDCFLEELIVRLIDQFNLRTFLRLKFWQRGDDTSLLEKFLVPGGSLGTDLFLGLASQPETALVEELKYTSWGSALRRSLEEWEKSHSLAILDRFLEEEILRFTRRGFYITFGREPLINYIFLKWQEIRRLRVIFGEKKHSLKVGEIFSG